LKDASGREIRGRVTLWAVHGIFAQRGWELRGLLTPSTISDIDSLNRVLKFTGNKSMDKFAKESFLNFCKCGGDRQLLQKIFANEGRGLYYDND
jgi:hypothetical protein